MVESWAALGVYLLKDLVFKEILVALGQKCLRRLR